MRLRSFTLAALMLALPTPSVAGDLFEYAGVRTHGWHFLEGARAEVGTVNPDKGESTILFGLNGSAGTIFAPSLDLTLGMRYWSADLDPIENEGSRGSFSDFSLHGDMNYHFFELWNLRPYGLAGLGMHFVGADIPGDQQLQDSIGGFGLGVDLGVGIASSRRRGLGFRVEARREFADQVENWNYTVGVGWWPGHNAVRVPSAPSQSQSQVTPTTSAPPPAATGAAPASGGGLSYTEAAALQSTIDRLTAENTALKNSGTTLAAPPATPESRAAAQRTAFQRMARSSGDPGGYSDTSDGVQFASERFINFPEGGSKLDTADQEQIRRLAVLLFMFPEARAQLQGHADASGSVSANQKVTNARATVVREELIRLGVPSNAITAEGLGSSRPVADNTSTQGRSANRRVSIRVTSPTPR